MLDRDSLRRVLEDKLRAEFSRARLGGALPRGPWPDSLPIGADGIAADSLELLTLAASVNEMFHIHETGIEDALLANTRFGDWVDLVSRAWAINSRRLTFLTSGSTGLPKRCPHDFAALRAEAAEHAARLRPTRVLAAVPSHHIYGFLFTVLLPRVAECEVVDIRGLAPGAGGWRAGDVLVSFPDHWRYLDRSMGRMPPITGVTSTAPMPADLARSLVDRGLSRLVQIYGSSETAGLAWRDDADSPFALLDGWTVADPPDGEGVAALVAADGRSAETPDVVVMRGPRAFDVLRRADGAVQVGGHNVFPERIAAALERHPLVARARVRLMAGHEGARLKALIVPRDDASDPPTVRRELETWIATNLPPHERPRSITVAPDLPTNGLGKCADWEMAS